MKIILDVMGGDNPASEFVKGAVLAHDRFIAENCDAEIILCGNERVIREALQRLRRSADMFAIVHAEDYVTMEDDPMSIVQIHKDSSMSRALKYVSDGKADACVSAGNTGALFTGATLIERRIRGVRRAALAMVLPYECPVLALDCGANVSVTVEYLVQFAYLGSVYMEKVMGVEKPRIGLLNNGAEAHKGTALYVETNKMLREASDLNFIGNVEAKDVQFNKCDVLVTDGFTGNIMLKSCEGISKFIMDKINNELFGGIGGKLSSLIRRSEVAKILKTFDVTEYGGAPFLGLAKPVIKAHGNSDANAVMNAVMQAVKYVDTGVIEYIGACADKFPKIVVNDKEK